MVIDKKRAFTLIEMMMAMGVILLATFAAMPVLTKSKPPVSKTTIRGQYACWRDNDGKLYQWLFDERSPRTEDPESISGVNDVCTFTKDQRPAYFYIYAVGKGDNGQLDIKALPTAASELKIYIPEDVNDVPVIAKSNVSTNPEVSAASTGNVIISNIADNHDVGNNGLIKGNIKSCKLISNGACPNDTSKTALGCEYVSGQEHVKIIGCESYDNMGNLTKGNIIPLECFTLKSPIDCSAIASADKTSKWHIKGSHYVSKRSSSVAACSEVSNGFEVGFEFNKPIMTLNKHVMNCSNAPDNNKFLTVLDSIPSTRQTPLLDELKANYKNGAVLILW